MKYLKFRPRTFPFHRYQELAVQTAKPLPNDVRERLDRMVYGLVGEIGELAEHVKKCHFQGHALDWSVIRKEMGDILWYLAVGADDLNFGLDSIAVENINKLRERYPDGFSTERSVHRES